MSAGRRIKESHLRSLLKGISWRVIGTLDTILLSYIFTGSIKIAAAIGGTEVISKVGLYYLHERAWQRVPTERLRQFAQKSRLSYLFRKRC
ncbi:MAG: DUF2061 domain-containing protein [Bacteroidota bacterium]